MDTEIRFDDVIRSEEELREVLGHPSPRVIDKAIDFVDPHCRAFIARAPFVLVASSDGAGRFDVSPKGDPPGFVRVLDDKTLAIPDRPGNRRADTFCNLLENPGVALLFLIPGVKETLRVSGTGRLVRDSWLRERMAVGGKVPQLALVVTVEEAFLHCAKCILRSRLWQAEDRPDPEGVPSLARAMVDHGRLEVSVEEMQEGIERDVRERLY